MATTLTGIPKWTLLYNITSSEEYVSRVREFFDTREAGMRRYAEESKRGTVPTLRPYNRIDEAFLEYP